MFVLFATGEFCNRTNRQNQHITEFRQKVCIQILTVSIRQRCYARGVESGISVTSLGDKGQ